MSASTATLANNRQVGGQHYKTGGIEHWDLFGPEYLIGCASKYVARHMEKNGREDLEKAIHYCEKMGEVLQGQKYVSSTQVSDLLEWARGTRMTGYEIVICYEIVCTVSPVRAVELISKLIEIKYPDTIRSSPGYQRALREGTEAVLRAAMGVVHTDALPQNRPGTPEDGGHHARQPVEEEEEEEEIQHWGDAEILEYRLPWSLSEHEWHHRCTKSVQDCYGYDVSAARYVILSHYTGFTKNGRED